MATVTPKSVLASKTLWANLSLVLGAAAAYFTDQADLNTTIALVAPAVLNFVLRLITKQPLDV